MKVLLIGGGGYLGGALAPILLAAGHEVIVFDKLSFGSDAVSPLLENPRYHFIKGDLRDISAVSRAMTGVEAVVLLAALVGEPACDKDPQATIDINYIATLSAVRSAIYHGVKRFIFTSTDSCYGAQENVFLKEDDLLKPISLYAQLKAQVEKEFFAFDAPTHFHPTILRLATLYGLAPRMRFDLVINLLTRETVVGNGAKIFSGEQWRPLVHVREAARAFLLALEAPAEKISRQIYNVGSNEQNVQFKDLAGILLEAIPGAKVETIPQPPDLRDYHVCFDSIRQNLGFAPELTPTFGITEIKEALESGVLGDPYQAKYRNA